MTNATVAAGIDGSAAQARSRRDPFFIFGCPRSGTSLLSLMLGAHPNLAVPFESHLYDSIYPIVQQHGYPERESDQVRLVSEILRTEHIHRWRPPPSLERTLAAIRHYDFHGIVDGLLSAWAQSVGKTRWGEKTPQHTLCWRTIAAGFPRLQIIHLVRDGRDVALSAKSAFFGPKHVYPLAKRWRDYVMAAETARATLGGHAFLQVRYEDLVADPEQALRIICSFLGEAFVPSMLDFYREGTSRHTDRHTARNLSGPVIAESVGRWRTGMTSREVRIFEALAGTALEPFGYERVYPEPRMRPWEAVSCRLIEHPPHRLSAMLRNGEGYKMALERLRMHWLLTVVKRATG